MQDKLPYFSIVLPSYNRAHFLPKAIQSVLAQSFQNWELIIVDDGSTDHTKELVADFIKADKRIKYIYQNNAERSAARNNGIANAQGKFICFLDSDDQYHPTHLQVFADVIQEKKEEEALYFSGVSMNSYDETPFSYNETHHSDQEFVLLNTIATPRACVYKEILVIEPFNTKIRIGEDKELWARIGENNPVYYHKKNTLIQTEHDSRSILGKSVYDNLNTLKFIINQHVIKKDIKSQLLSNAYFSVLKYELAQNKRFTSIKFVIKSLLADINHSQSKMKLNVLMRLIRFQALSKIRNII